MVDFAKVNSNTYVIYFEYDIEKQKSVLHKLSKKCVYFP